MNLVSESSRRDIRRVFVVTISFLPRFSLLGWFCYQSCSQQSTFGGSFEGHIVFEAQFSDGTRSEIQAEVGRIYFDLPEYVF